MFRIITIVISICILALAYLHSALGGLIIAVNKDGSKWFSNELMSSGGDDSDILLLGLLSFILTLVFYLFKKTETPHVYYINLLFVYFTLFLVNLDVSIIGSIQYGDYVLLIVLLLMHIPLIYQLTKHLKRTLNNAV